MRLKEIVLLLAVVATPARALQVLDAVDHAELAAEVSATSVNRIALEDDRIERVIRGPDGFEIEHDPTRGDIYLKPQHVAVGEMVAGEAEKEWGPPGMFGGVVPTSGDSTNATGETGKTLFLGSEKGFTYRLTLKAADRGSAQILIRNIDLFHAQASGAGGLGYGGRTGGAVETGDGYIGELTGLVRAIVNRRPLPGFSIFPGGGEKTRAEELSVVEVWQGPGLTAQVVELVDAPNPELEKTGAGGLAEWYGDSGSAVAAAWLSEPGAAPRGGRMGVVVFRVR